jgi:alanine racemase
LRGAPEEHKLLPAESVGNSANYLDCYDAIGTKSCGRVASRQHLVRDNRLGAQRYNRGTGPDFAEVNARPVIDSLVEMAEWDVFVASSQWTGGCALHVDTGGSRLGISMEEAAAFAPRVNSPSHGIALLMSRLDNAERPDHPLNDRQIRAFHDLRRLYRGIPASLANSAGIFVGPKTHFDVARPGAALYGINPTPASPIRCCR